MLVKVRSKNINFVSRKRKMKRTLIKNRSSFIAKAGAISVNVVDYLYKTWRRVAARRTVDLYSLSKFKKYKNDWTYPVSIRHENPKVPKKQASSFLAAIKVPVMIGQCFALNPVDGVYENDANKLQFRFKSWRCLYTLLSLIGQMWLASYLVCNLFDSNSSAVDTAKALLFYMIGILTTILFWCIATYWPRLCMDISKMEASDPTMDRKLKFKLTIACCGVLIPAAFEHLFAELHGIALAIDCAPETPIYEAFIRLSFTWIFGTVQYNNFIGAITHFLNVQCTFNWNFTDLFVICMSLYLTSRLEQVNRRVRAAKDKNSPPSFWRTLREDYNKTIHLVRQVDDVIGGVIFVSFAGNLFFICCQLLNTLAGGIQSAARCKETNTPDGRYMKGYEYSIYFVFSFTFLVARSLTVSLTASRVHAASLEPAFALYDVPSTTYCVEIERFLEQIHGNTIALSGLRFFNVKRGLILTIAGTVVTYELVLMQFTGVKPSAPSHF